MFRRFPIIVAAACLFAGCYSVTPVNADGTASGGGLYYALPRTEICVDVTYQYYDLKEAVFSEYATEMLALDNFDVEKPYRIKNIETTYTVSADPDHYYLVNPNGISVQVDSRHLLRAVGMTPQEVVQHTGPAQSAGHPRQEEAKLVLHNATADKMLPSYNLIDRTDTFYVRGDRPGNPTGLSTKKAPRSLRQRAQAAAEEIAELEDTRADIALSDRYTPEGKSELLKQLEEKEAVLLAQFIGKPVVETVHFYITPKAPVSASDTVQRGVLFYFSRIEGVCESDDYGAMPVVYTLRLDKSLQHVRQFNTQPKGLPFLKAKNFKYRLPSQAQMLLSCELFDYRVTLPVAQYGPVIDLPHKHFKALFEPTTGSIVYYEN